MSKQKQIIYSAIQPSGDPHIGNYLGAIKNWIDLQESGEYQMIIAIADLHSITQDYDVKHKQEQIRNTLIDLISAGIDPEKTILFVQSHVPETAELAWYLNCLTPMAELERMTQFKDKATRYKNVNAGLFTYPVLQSADVLLFKGTHVPVGEDQVQHVELMRKHARWFNKRFTPIFPEPKVLLTKAARVMSLAEPTKKMSKSNGEKHYIALADEPEIILQKLKKAVTDKAGADNLLELLGYFAPKSVVKKFSKKDDIRFSDLKVELAAAISDYFAPFREHRKVLLADPTTISSTITKTTKQAQQIASATLEEVRKSIGIR